MFYSDRDVSEIVDVSLRVKLDDDHSDDDGYGPL
jgi:hypothetical protein